ncbi:hypothetical protein L228DRAFT_261383 [Xylona heveae TC161]|uniref:C2 NT-type domain-containing protein n=1 Tax=Xylona heveae (strain CBS 132557 / TC161) TaxID=1328760 RepID=A0A165GGZ9_XYLHT|nr:hypothetical protein L228DRAFT_261383 [Xylona heveae TC161]KZF22174.1 hypothetical protein L228DRAFT_261383 [Xylona heveae TC161]
MQAFVPKARRPKFELRLKILDLNNVPLVSGTSYVKWHLPLSTSAEHRGRTSKSMIKEHKVIWDYEKTLHVRLVVDKHGMLQSSEIHFEVVQVYASGSKGESITLGLVKLNLAEYVAESDTNDESAMVRRYLMQDSKINSTLKISIYMKLLEGEKNFIAPPLRSAPVFGGIAGIIANEQSEQQDERGQIPSIAKSRETEAQQDIYRQTLAAWWSAPANELPADQCVENIFAGGTGWERKPTHRSQRSKTSIGESSDSMSDGEGRRSSRHRRDNSGFGASSVKSNSRLDAEGDATTTSASQQSSGPPRLGRQARNVVDEFDAREDLRSWQIPSHD